MRSFSTLATMILVAACSGITPAQMRLPSEFASASERIAYSGIGGGTHGRFQVGAYKGGFERSEKRLAFFDTVVKNYGHSEFVIEGPEISSTIEARCRMRERVIDLQIAEFKPRKMAYICEFTADGRTFPSRFELQETAHGLGGALSRQERQGEIALGGETVQFRSVHKLAGSYFEMASPIGYIFEQDGRPVGAVELNGSPVLILSDRSDQGLARTITVAATALAVFWDPANSALGD